MGKKGTKRKTRWRVLPIGEDGGSGSGNEEEADCENGACVAGSYARATQQHRPIGRRPNSRPPGYQPGYYNKHHNTQRSYNNHDNHQPLVTTEKHIFNEEEYTKITTPRQDVLFKKGYLGRKRPTVTTESADQTTSADVANGNAMHFDPSSGHNEVLDNDPNEMVEEQPQFIYTNGFVDQSGVYYINGSGYEIFDPYSGQVTVVVGPHYGPNGGPPVLAAVPCQPVPLQPLEWFNPPGFLPYVTAPGPAGVPRDRRKRYSTDSQNCSPQSSESTGPPGSPQESDEVALTGGPEGAMYTPHHPPPPPPYVYPGYMFGAPMYNMNGVTVQSTPNAAPSSDVGGKRRKKKRRRRRRRNGVEDGSEESSSEDKDHEEGPMSVTSQESSLESDSKLSSPGPPVAKSNAHTQTSVAIGDDADAEEEQSVESDQRPTSAHGNRDAATETADFPPLVNGFETPGPELAGAEANHFGDASSYGVVGANKEGLIHKDVVVNGDRLVNGHESKSKGDRKTERKGKKVSNNLTNGVVEKPLEVSAKQVDESDDFAFQDDSFLYTQEFINGNVKVDLDQESEWITVKGHKGSQGKRSDPARFNEDKKFPPELTNGHARFGKDNRLNGFSGKDKLPYKNSSDKFIKTDRGCHNGKVEEKCTYTKARQAESGNREKTPVSNGRARPVNGGKMDGNEREVSESEEVAKRVVVETSVGNPAPESPQEPPRKSEAEEATPNKPSRRERRSAKNGSPPKTPETTTLTATAKPFEMPSVSLRPEGFAKRGDAAAPRPDKQSREDSLLAGLTVSEKAVPDVSKSTTIKEAVTSKRPGEASKKTNGNGGDKRRKTPPGPDSSKVDPPRDLATKSAEPEDVDTHPVRERAGNEPSVSSSPRAVVKSAKDASKELIEQESRRDDEPPVPPPRRKKWHPSSKRERAPTPGKGDSTDESSSSSSQESEESVIECLSSGFNSPKVKVASGFSSDDEDVIYQGSGEEQDPKALGRISESQEETAASVNGKASRQVDAGGVATPTTPDKRASEEAPRPPAPQTSAQTVEIRDADEGTSGTSRHEEHLQNVQKIAQEIVDSIIQEALRESVRLKYRKENDPVKLGITDAVTRWLRSQSPDVLSLPRNEDSDSDLTDADLEADDGDNPPNGSKNLKSNPLPVPSVENVDSQLNAKDLIGAQDGMGRRVANTISEEKHLKDSRNDTPDLEDDAISNSSVSCGEWDLWDCHHTIPHNYEEILNKPQRKHTKNTNETNIISPNETPADSPSRKRPRSSRSSVKECSSAPPGNAKYDPLANDTFSPIESTLLAEVADVDATRHDHCSTMCDPTLSVAKYYKLGSSLSPVEDLECCSDASSSLTENPDVYRVSLAEELARLEQPLPASWAVEQLRLGGDAQRRCASCHCRQRDVATTADSGVESGDEGVVTKKSVFKRRLVGRLKGEGAPFPYGGICCILQ